MGECEVMVYFIDSVEGVMGGVFTHCYVQTMAKLTKNLIYFPNLIEKVR